MGKRRKRNRQAAAASPETIAVPRRRKRIHRQRDRVLVVMAVLLAGFIAWSWWRASGFEEEFIALAREGQESLSGVREYRSLGRSHLPQGQSYRYSDRFPTSGPHDLYPIDPGFYTEMQPPTKLVHSLEHGHIVIYYDEPAPEVLDRLRAWADHYTGHWDGVVVVPRLNLGEEIVMSAWTRNLHLEPFDAAAAAAFIDAHRGRGPENPVR